VTPSDLARDAKHVRSAKRIGAVAAVAALGAFSIALLNPSAAGADPTSDASPTPSDTTPAAPAPTDISSALPADTNDLPVAPAEFGLGKVNATVLPIAGTYTAPADLSGTTYTLTSTSSDDDPRTCTSTTVDGSCIFGDVDLSESYTLTQTAAAPGFFIDPTVTIISASEIQPASIDPGDIEPAAFNDHGTNRIVGVTLTSTVVSTALGAKPPLAGGTFELFGPAPVIQITALDATPTAVDGSLATATTADDGSLTFAGNYAPGDGYYLLETAAPVGYTGVTGQIPVDVPVPATIPETGVTLFTPVENVPDIPAPLLTPDVYTVTTPGEDALDVLANDTLYDDSAYILYAVVEHGTIRIAEDPACVAALAPGAVDTCRLLVYYTPTDGFIGVETMDYAVETRGGTAATTATITVVAPAPAPAVLAVAPLLANTGAGPLSDEFGVALGLLAAGAGLALAGARRRA
jgi:hypothetical protein